jgi:hypothetical protein
MFERSTVTSIGILADNLYRSARADAKFVGRPATAVQFLQSLTPKGGASVTIREAEFAALRRTIASRGTARVALFVTAVVAWAVLATVQGLFSDLPLLALVPLIVLVGGFESVWALHVGVERIGRFIQVVYESPDGASWETTSMRAAPGLPGGGADPLFASVFAAGSLVNLAVAFVAEPTPLETVLLFAAHGALLLRIALARLAAARQRRADLEAFKTVHQTTDP